MADATHAYVVFEGGYPDILAEHWQFGVRFMLVNSGTTPDNVGTLPTFSVDEVEVSRTESDWTISSLWNAGLGFTETINVDDWLNDQLAPAVVDLAANGKISNQVTFESIKASPISSTGHVVGLRTSLLEFTGTLPTGVVGVPMLPAQNSVVTSWVTERIGRKGRGRVYLPPTGSAVLHDQGQLDSSIQASLLTAMVAFVEALAITPTGLGNHWALPIVTGSPWTDYAVIQGVRVGNIIDTQRRRRRQEVETYASSAVSYG